MPLQTLDLVLGLVGIYVFLSLICTAARELLAQFFETRANTLLTGLRKLLDGDLDQENTWGLVEWMGGIEGKADLSALGDESLTKKLYDHPLIQGLSEGPGKPSYIPPRAFATALLEVVDAASDEGSRSLDSVREGVEALPEGLPLRSALTSLLNEAEDDLEQFRDNLKTWYNDSMDRVASWYKKHTQRAVVVIAALIAIGANADTLHMAERLSTNEAAREAAVQQARRISGTGSIDAAADSLGALVEAYGNQGLPLGWGSEVVPPPSFNWAYAGYWASKLFGLFLTTIAIALGAPFWFDVLKKVSTIRSGGRSPREG